MNERIKELARQAFINAEYDTDDPLFDILFKQGTEFHEKFAELIVRECRVIIMDEVKRKLGQEDYQFVDGIQHGSEIIKEHFGVEE